MLEVHIQSRAHLKRLSRFSKAERTGRFVWLRLSESPSIQRDEARLKIRVCPLLLCWLFLSDCSVCSNGYTADLSLTCSKCSDSTGGIVLAAVLTAVALAVVGTVVSHVMSGEVRPEGAGTVGRLRRYIPLQSLKIVIVAWQILTQVRVAVLGLVW